MKNNSDNEKNNKFSELVNNFKEAWAIPQKRAGIKLLGYLIFFIVFFLIAGIGSRNNVNMIQNNDESNITTTTTSIDTESYTYKQKLLLENKHYIKYEITFEESVYNISGSISEGILEGYLETNYGIKKIRIENSIIYEIENGNSVPLDINIDSNFLDIKNLINMFKTSRAFIEEKDDIKMYTYNIEGYVIKVFSDINNINKIEINNGLCSYILNFDI